MGRKRIALLTALAMTLSVLNWAAESAPQKPNAPNAPAAKKAAPKPAAVKSRPAVLASARALTTPPPDEMDTNVVKVLRTTNKGQVNQYICRVFNIVNVNPYEIINFPELLAEAEEGMIYTFAHPSGVGGKILVTAPAYQMPYYESLIRGLDRPKITSAPGSKYIFYRAKHRNAPWLARQATYYGGSADIFFPDVETNSVLLFAVPSGADAAEKAMSDTDYPTPQALIEVTLYDVKLTNDGAFGLDFQAWKNGPGRFALAAGARYQWLGINRDASVPIRTNGYADGNSHGQGFFLDYPSAYFDFLVEKGKARMMSSTRAAAINYERAVFATAEQVLTFQVSQNNVLDRRLTGVTESVATSEHVTPLAPLDLISTRLLDSSRTAPPQLAIVPVPTGIFVDVVPVINANLVEMDIVAKVISITGFDDSGQPVLNSRQFSSNVQVAPNQEIVIGGLTRDRKIDTANKIPVLGSIPILGWAFGNEIQGTEKTMVVAVIRPIIENFPNPFDSPLKPEDEQTIMQATGDAPIAAPPTVVGFEQYGLDPAK